MLVGKVRGQLGHRVGAEVAAVRHDRGQYGADVLGRGLGGRQEMAGEAQLVIDLDQELGQFHAAHVLCQPGFELGQAILRLLVQFLVESVDKRQPYSSIYSVAVARRRLQTHPRPSGLQWIRLPASGSG
jgi:7-keto-8-aminopelargonate synthetase-like enzyme